MPLSPPAPRKHIHTRTIDARGYQRDDGMWDVEANLRDVKTYEIPNAWRGALQPGDPVHDMWVRLTIDNGFIVRAVETTMDATPFEICGNAAPAFQGLIGQRVGPGWGKAVRNAAGGTAGCTHVSELMRVLATVAFQTIYPMRRKELETALGDRRPPILDTCVAWAADSPVTQKAFPDWYESETAED